MARKLGILVFVLCVTVAWTFRVHAQPQVTHPVTETHGTGEADRLRHEIHDLRQQEKLLRPQLEEAIAKVRQLRAQMRIIHDKIVADREKLESFGGGHRGRHRASGQHHKEPITVQTPEQPIKAIPAQLQK